MLNEFSRAEQSNNVTNFFEGKITLEVGMILPHNGRGRRIMKLDEFGLDRSQVLDITIDQQNLCLPISILLAIEYSQCQEVVEAKQRYKAVRQFSAKLKNKTKCLKIIRDARKLMRKSKCKISTTHSAEREGRLIYEYLRRKCNNKYSLYFFESNQRLKPFVKYGEPVGTVPIVIYHENNHYMGIKNYVAFIGAKKYCFSCCSTYTIDERHNYKCKLHCNACFKQCRDGPCKTIKNEDVVCLKCNIYIPNKICLSNHEKKCGYLTRCLDCGKFMISRSRKSVEHECGKKTKFCPICKIHHNPRECFIQPIKTRKTKDYKIIAYDFETIIVDENHVVNYASAYIMCTKCLADGTWKKETDFECDFCGEKRLHSWSMLSGIDPIKAFIDWIIAESNNKKKIIAFAHYGAKFDSQLVFRELYKRGYSTFEMTRNGLKIFQLKYSQSNRHGDILFKDSYKFFSISLKKTVQAFDLHVDNKGYFPYHINSGTDFTLDHLPSINDYGYEEMMIEDQRVFMEWYEENKHKSFNLKTELQKYGDQDTRILAHALAVFRKNMMLITGICPYLSCSTIASSCMSFYLAKYLKKDTMAITPSISYFNKKAYSQIATKFLMYLNEVEGKNIIHAGSPEQEQLICGHYVDGYDAETNTVYLINGLYYHGAEHFDDDKVLANGKTNRKCLEETEIMIQMYKDKGYNVEVFTDEQIQNMLKKDKDMKDKFSKYRIPQPLKMKDAYFGGRCAPMQLYAKADDDYNLYLFDFVSMYPAMLFSKEYMIGQPELINFGMDNHVNITDPEDLPYFGLVQAFVVPPNDLSIPILPYRTKAHLTFPLCSSCADFYTDKSTYEPDYTCQHSDDERGWIGTFTTIELKYALLRGYRITQIFSVQHYHEKTDQMFKEYIRNFMKIKIESSGYPSDVKTDEEKADYLLSIENDLSVTIDPDNVKKNSGMRYISKVCFTLTLFF